MKRKNLSKIITLMVFICLIPTGKSISVELFLDSDIDVRIFDGFENIIEENSTEIGFIDLINVSYETVSTFHNYYFGVREDFPIGSEGVAYIFIVDGKYDYHRGDNPNDLIGLSKLTMEINLDTGLVDFRIDPYGENFIVKTDIYSSNTTKVQSFTEFLNPDDTIITYFKNNSISDEYFGIDVYPDQRFSYDIRFNLGTLLLPLLITLISIPSILILYNSLRRNTPKSKNKPKPRNK